MGPIHECEVLGDCELATTIQDGIETVVPDHRLEEVPY